MTNHEIVVMVNKGGTIYPVAMADEQLNMIRFFVAGISKDEPFVVLNKVPIIEALEIVERADVAYQHNKKGVKTH